MDVVARLGTGDPLRAAARVRDPAVDGGGELERDERTIGLLSGKEERRVERGGLFREQADLRLDTGALQHFDAASRFGIGIAHRRDDAPDAGGTDGVGARRRLAVMRARLEGDDERRPARLVAGREQRRELGVRTAILGVPPLRDRFIAAEHHGADEGIGGDATPSTPRELERAAHGRQLALVISLQTAPQACCPRGPLR